MQKLRNLLGGGGEVIKRLHWITGGRGGGLRGPKKGLRNSLMAPKTKLCKITKFSKKFYSFMVKSNQYMLRKMLSNLCLTFDRFSMENLIDL